jgi:sugar/nucleoside kinase (ribokinase family)
VKILSLGDLLLDVVVCYDPQSGEADMGPEGAQIWPGGSAANFAVQVARLGAEVRFVGRVGRDWAGEMLVRSLESEGVTTSIVADEKEPSGRVLVMVDPQGSRRMWSYPGASAAIRTEDLDPSWFAGVDVVHLTGYSLLREGPRAAALQAAQFAKDVGCRFLTLDPNPPHLIDDFGARKFRGMIAGLGFDLIFPNIDEGRLLTGLDKPEEIGRDLLGIAPLVALKLGSEGSLVTLQGGKQLQVDAHQAERVVDVTGAGDAFAAGFVVEYVRSGDPRKAAEAANRLAAGVVARRGAR